MITGLPDTLAEGAENAPLRRAQQHSEVVAAIEARITQRLLRETLQWVQQLDKQLCPHGDVGVLHFGPDSGLVQAV